MSIIQKIVSKWQYFVSSFFYLGYARKALQYSFWRDGIERRFLPPALQGFERPGKLLEHRTERWGVHCRFEHSELTVRFLAVDLVRCDWLSERLPVPYAIARDEWPAVAVEVQAGAQGIEATTGAMRVRVTPDGRVRFADADGRILRAELPPDHQRGGWVHRVSLAEEERIYGLGERAAPLNLRQARDAGGGATAFQMWNFDMAGRYGPGADPLYISIPLYISLQPQGSYLVFYENSFPAAFTFKQEAVAAFEGGALRYYVGIGPVEKLLERYTELTGRPPLPPKWALGYHQSRWGYETEAAVRNVARAFEANDIPVSAIHLDIDVMDDFKAFTIDPRRFPLLGEFTRELARRGVRLVSILNPAIKADPDLPIFRDGMERKAFVSTPDAQPVIAPVWPGWCAFPDFSDPEVRHWWSEQYRHLLSLGIAGFWHDMNEPAAFVAWGDRSLPRPTRHSMEGRGGDHREAHNLYGLLQARAGYESLRTFRPEARPFIVSRAGWAGLQRYAWTWTGDTESSWGALAMTVAQVLELGLCGIPYSGPDTGGFRGNPSSELYIRWMQLSAFLPFFRTHASNDSRSRAPWTFGEPSLGIARAFIKLRYRLLPYLYTLCWEASRRGVPLVRPLFWADPGNARLWDIDDAFLLGDALAVYPVVREGERAREVVLPAGRWYHLWDDQVLEGPGSIRLDAPIERIPLLVKAGSVLPMEEDGHLALHLYAPESGAFEGTIYEDAGDGYGANRIERLRFSRCGAGFVLERSWEGDFAFPYRGVRIFVHGVRVGRARVDGQPVPFSGAYLQVSDFRTLELD
ncbi:DUF4968 domain-containing protein [Gloeobacter morelensis MG652769]|uniref:DUF4968 domain-containing protein n=1 Tax=Gloeobacter morelensis MG652769 TaxID=2781736 RepID=A0ABY3PPC7_9CYAN|nr:DUF4968 domain-containing protein [Gloeobacter morelensis MG652769]